MEQNKRFNVIEITLAVLQCDQISVLLGDITFRTERGLIGIWRKECGLCSSLQFQSACSCLSPWRARTCSSRISIQMSWATWVSRRNHDRGYPASPLARCEKHAPGFLFAWKRLRGDKGCWAETGISWERSGGTSSKEYNPKTSG